ncbi:hypothetical protein [Erythrobacter aureus]|uniref:Phytanoyl-CoA dioxygenase n=1 Tax=Erythrobacter aureus TaxID=2182384 RepID=A0A345YFP8_9SPHN|nr:hypothetical protein [Erythrobacter aureus]AXK42750.1 hypothetical protein DVR09_10795 [Erythrobacter aureus]
MTATGQNQDYDRDGYVHIRKMVPREIASGFLVRLKNDLSRQGVSFDKLEKMQPLLNRPAPELYGYHYPPMATFHWGLTPAISLHTGRDLLPTYAYFRIYRRGDICKVHGDRPACEHSLSLTLGYSDDRIWPLDVANEATGKPYERADASFRDDESYSSAPMEVGDAVLYQGVTRHHGRVLPNPNEWSAHLFMHWVERDGAFADSAFDGQSPPAKVTL